MDLLHERNLPGRFQCSEVPAFFNLRGGVERSESGEIAPPVFLRVNVLEHPVDEPGHPHVNGSGCVGTRNDDLSYR